MEELIGLIGSVGFPIVACGFMGYGMGTFINRLMIQLEKFGMSLDKFNTTLLLLDNRVEKIEKLLGDRKHE